MKFGGCVETYKFSEGEREIGVYQDRQMGRSYQGHDTDHTDR